MKTPILLLMLVGCDETDDTGFEGGLKRDDLGRLTVGYDGFTDELSFNVPNKAISAMIDCQDIGDQYSIQLYTLTMPDGSLAWTAEDPDAHPFRADILMDVSAVLIPESPDLDIVPGKWVATYNTDSAYQNKMDCQATYRMDDLRQNVLNLDIYLVDLPGIKASTAADNIGLQAMLAETFRLWDAAFDAGEIRYHDVTEDPDTYTVLNIGRGDTAFAEYNDLMRMADADPNRTVPVFLVKEIWDRWGEVIYGISSGTPGAATVMGSSRSGVAITTSDLDTSPEFVGHNLAHEIGHFLGLFHTTDEDGDFYDCLADTPECPKEADYDGNEILNSDECQDYDTWNLMFWTSSNNDILTEDQIWVVQRNPAVE